MTEKIENLTSQCPYCGVGCGLEMQPPAESGKAVRRDADGYPMWRSRGDRNHPSNLGQICIKGATVGETLSPGRLNQPLYRANFNEKYQEISWNEATDKIVSQIKKSLIKKGPNSIAMYGSGQFHTEDYYIAQKLLKGALGTNNFDANSRLCMLSLIHI